MNPAPVLATLLQLRLWSGDAQEDPANRAERLQNLAVAVASASASREEEAFLLALGEAETHFAAYVGEDRCHEGPKGMQCDHGKARSYFQLHRQACPALFELERGDPVAVAVAASCAVQLYRFGKYTCKSAAGAFNIYAGNSCSKGQGQVRSKRMTQIAIMLEHSGIPWPSEPVVHVKE